MAAEWTRWPFSIMGHVFDHWLLLNAAVLEHCGGVVRPGDSHLPLSGDKSAKVGIVEFSGRQVAITVTTRYENFRILQQGRHM